MKTTPSDNNKAYWRANVSLLSKLLVVWFVVSFGCGIILVAVSYTHLTLPTIYSV